MTRKAYQKELDEWLQLIRDDKSLAFRVDENAPDETEFGNLFSQIYAITQRAGSKSPISRAFAVADLQLENVIHWHLLMGVFCELHFPIQRRTKPTKRTRAFKSRLAARVRDFRLKNPNKSREEEAEEIARLFPGEYGTKASTVRRVIVDMDKPPRRRKVSEPKSAKMGRRQTLVRKLLRESAKLTVAERKELLGRP